MILMKIDGSPSQKLEIPIDTSIKQIIRRNHYPGNAKFGIFSSRIRLGQILHLVSTIAIEIFGLVAFNWLQQLGNSTEFEDLKFFQFGKYLLQVQQDHIKLPYFKLRTSLLGPSLQIQTGDRRKKPPHFEISFNGQSRQFY